MRPYKIVAYDIGAASLMNRDTGERIGVLLQNYHGEWAGHSIRVAGDGESQRGELVRERYRKDAARELWKSLVGEGSEQ